MADPCSIVRRKEGSAPSMPAAMDDGDWTLRTTKKPPVDSTAGDRSLRLSSTHLKAFLVLPLKNMNSLKPPTFRSGKIRAPSSTQPLEPPMSRFEGNPP
uniref:Uncharacterized protein n=1 Tax=Fagus sylvatica TaxID=28930 RepID=A0A2N9GUK5_FAGSY